MAPPTDTTAPPEGMDETQALYMQIADLQDKLASSEEMKELFEARYNKVHSENLSAELTQRRMQKVIDQLSAQIQELRGTVLEPGQTAPLSAKGKALKGSASPAALTQEIALPAERKPPKPPSAARKPSAKKPPPAPKKEA